MKSRLILLPLAILASASCDKAKELADKASTAVKKEIAAQSATAESTEDPELRNLVDQTEEGVVFRKDLPFPNRLEVKTVRLSEMTGRFMVRSAMGNESNVVNGLQTVVTKFERAGEQVRYTLEKSDFSEPLPDGQEAKAPSESLEAMVTPGKPWLFRKVSGKWKPETSHEFHAVTVGRQLAPVFDELLIEQGVMPRAMWFAKRRFKVGDTLTVTGAQLPMLLAGDAKGSFDLKLEALEPVAGHPCGVFSVTGDYSRKGFPDFEGNLVDAEVTIQSGKLWLSLIYPIVLREELDTIQTTRSGGRSGIMQRGQGTVKLSVTREWKSLDEKPAPAES